MSTGLQIPNSPFARRKWNDDTSNYVRRMINLYPELALYSKGYMRARHNVSVFWMVCENHNNVPIDIIDSMLSKYPHLINSKLFVDSTPEYVLMDNMDDDLLQYLIKKYASIMEDKLKEKLPEVRITQSDMSVSTDMSDLNNRLCSRMRCNII